MKRLCLLSVLLLSGCAGQYIPPCDVTNKKVGSWFTEPCVGWSNGTQASPREADMKQAGKTYYPAIIYTDESNAMRAMSMRKP